MISLFERLFILLGAEQLQAIAWANKWFGFTISCLFLGLVYLVIRLIGKLEDYFDDSYDTKAIGDDPIANAKVSSSKAISAAIFWGLTVAQVLN